MTKEEIIAVCAKYGYSEEWVEAFLKAKPPEIKLEEMTRQDLIMGILAVKQVMDGSLG